MTKIIIRYLNLLLIYITFIPVTVKSKHEKNRELIYILWWAGDGDVPATFWQHKRKSFIANNCEYQNCYIVGDREYFEDVTDYDAILFNIAKLYTDDVPLARADNQLYVFVALEPAQFWPIDGEKWNLFFNYTMTYRLDSDILYPYFLVRDRKGKVVGPNLNARWRNITRMRSTPASVIKKLENKTLAAAWFVTNCYGYNKRLAYGHGINTALQKYNLSVDVYGRCGNKQCLKDHYHHCLSVVERTYYFYFAFENSNCEDYVTEKLTTGLQHYSVPVVLGGANYSRFLPEGTYLNGNIMSEEEVAAKIYEAIKDKQTYYDYFKWHRYYTFNNTESNVTNPLCALCALLNTESVRNQRRVYTHFDYWWDKYKSRFDEGMIESYQDSASYIKGVVSFRSKPLPPPAETQSTIQEINTFVDDVVNYFFGS